jgi:hypothetical protein
MLKKNHSENHESKPVNLDDCFENSLFSPMPMFICTWDMNILRNLHEYRLFFDISIATLKYKLPQLPYLIDQINFTKTNFSIPLILFFKHCKKLLKHLFLTLLSHILLIQLISKTFFNSPHFVLQTLQKLLKHLFITLLSHIFGSN